MYIANNEYEIISWPKEIIVPKKHIALNLLLNKRLKSKIENTIMFKCGNRRSY